VERAEREELRRQLAALAAGDRDAFHPVFVCLWPIVRAFASRQLPPGDAEDAAQQALIKAFGRASSYDPGRDPLTWVLTITAYEIKTSRRQRLRRREDAEYDAEQQSAPGPTPEQSAVDRDLGLALDSVLATLPAQDAATLRAYAWGTPPDVAPATFRKRAQRALARLRTAWRRTHGRG
jgi:RNA polymerase sigma-70 factor, ECF subfamily